MAKVWPLQSDLKAMRKVYGNPDANGDGSVDPTWVANNLTAIVPPYQFYYGGKKVSKITLHRAIVEPVTRALTKIAKLYPDAKVRKKLGIDQFDGCFNFRPKRSGSGQLSMHAYAAALDFSAARNRYKAGKSDLPAPFIKAFTDEGATWLGPSLDPMHFQFARTK